MYKKIILSAIAIALSSTLYACGDEAAAAERAPRNTEISAVSTDIATTEYTRPTRATQSTGTTAVETRRAHLQTTTTTTAAYTRPTRKTTTTTTTESTFVLSDELVAEKIYTFFTDKGYTTEQVCGIIGNAEIESGLEPSRGIAGGGFGLFQLQDCPQRDAMFEAFEANGVGKYATASYWGRGASNFDSRADFDAFMDVLLTYTMDPNDTDWQNELYLANDPEMAAEVFLVNYERAIGGDDQIIYYEPAKDRYYQAAAKRRDSARKWYNYFSS